MVWMSGAVFFKALEDLDIKMKGGAHASTDDLWVKMVDGWRNDANILNIKCGGGAHDGAEVASVRRIHEEEMVGFFIELALSFLKLSNEKAGVFGGQNVERLARFCDLNMLFRGKLQDFPDIFAVLFGRAEEDLRYDFWSGFEELKN